MARQGAPGGGCDNSHNDPRAHPPRWCEVGAGELSANDAPVSEDGETAALLQKKAEANQKMEQADSSPRWHEYMGKNCYKGHGSSDPIGAPEQLRVHTVDSCADRCKQISAVGFVLTSDNMQCYCRHNMNIDECQDDRAWDTFVFE